MTQSFKLNGKSWMVVLVYRGELCFFLVLSFFLFCFLVLYILNFI